MCQRSREIQKIRSGQCILGHPVVKAFKDNAEHKQFRYFGKQDDNKTFVNIGLIKVLVLSSCVVDIQSGHYLWHFWGNVFSWGEKCVQGFLLLIRREK